MRKYFVVAIASLLSACGPDVDGTYKDSLGVTSYTFDSGKVIVSAMGVGTEMDYEVDDGRIKITSPQGVLVMEILDDGSIAGPLGMKLTKEEK